MLFVLDFLKEYLWEPMVHGQGYNPVNTLFIALFFVGAVEVYWRFFAGKANQSDFRRASIPFMVLGGLLRFADARLFPHSVLMVTPGVYLVVLAAFSLFYRFAGADMTQRLGWLAAAVALLLVLPFLAFGQALLLLPVGAVCVLVSWAYGRLKFMEDCFAWMPHVFEAWITSFGVWAGLVEEHVIAGALMGYSPFVFGLVKTLMLPLIMWLIRDTEKKQRAYVGTIIGMIGLGPGVRDLMELLSLGG